MGLRQQIAQAIADGLMTADDIQAAVEAAEQVRQVKDQILRLAAENGLTVTFGDASPARADQRKSPVPPKYRDQSGNVWSGRGMKPRWLQEHISAGRSIEEFAVQ